MTMPCVAYGSPAVIRIFKALGLDSLPVVKAVIEIPADDIMKVYVALAAEEKQLDEVAAVFEGLEILPVADVIVDDAANVTVTPLPPPTLPFPKRPA